MPRAWITLPIALLLLVGVDFGLERLERTRRGTDPRIERLVAKERQAGATVAAVSVERSGESLLYVRKKGLWRSREAYGAVCDAPAVEALLAAFLEARGVTRTEDPARARDYGLSGAEPLVVALHGPRVLDADDRDVIFSFEVGRSFAEGPRGRAFVRESGSSRILEIDRDPRALLEPRGLPDPRALLSPPADQLPPLVDTHLLAGSTSERFRGFRELRFEIADGRSFRVANEESGWFLERDGRKETCLPWRVGGCMGLWLRGRLAGVESPSRAVELGLDRPAARITLVPDDGEPIEIALSAVDARHRTYVWNRKTNVVAAVQSELGPLLAPAPELFLDASRPNPWEEWLRKQ